jgi:dolichol-phosphate mannosyltransferase
MIVIATYNERANIRPLVAAIRQAVPVEPILFVDDNSPDRTDDEIRAVALEYGHITLSSRPGKLGLGSAYREVFIKAAAENSYDYVITMDGDLSHPPSQLPAIIHALAEYPVVIGSRYTAGGGTENWKLRRRILSRCANLYARICCGVPARDLTAGFVGYRTELLRKLPIASVRSEGYSFLIEMKYLVHKAGAPIKEVPITFVERREGKSKLSSGVAMEAVKFTTRTLFKRIF